MFKTQKSFGIGLGLALCLASPLLPPLQAQIFTDDGLVILSGPASPRVAYNLQRDKTGLTATVFVAQFSPQQVPGVQLGVAGDKTLVLINKDAKVSTVPQGTRLEFKIPIASLVNNEAGWEKLRLGLHVSWPGGPLGQPRQAESFHLDPTLASHSGLGSNPRFWQPVSLTELEKANQDRRLQIAVDYFQPTDGKATLVIEDANGRRVRNLISGATMPKGPRRVVWDGRDDAGLPMAPGQYRWRAIAHAGLKPNYLFSYADGPGSNHGTFHAATTNGTHIFFGTSVSEGGYELVQMAPDGKFLRGFNAPHGHGLGKVAIAADDKFLYAAYDGTGWGTKVDRTKPDWKVGNEVSLIRFNLENGSIADFSRTERFARIRSYMVGPGSPEKRGDVLALAGLTLHNGKLYMGDSLTSEVVEIDPATGATLRTLPLTNPVALAGGGAALHALSGADLVQLDLAIGTTKKLVTLTGSPAGLTRNASGQLFVSDKATHTVQLLDAAGKSLGLLGKAGGIAPGPYDPLKMHNPAGLVVSPSGQLWVTESNRWQPKRLAAYDLKTKTMWKEYFGPTAYGAPGAGFDPADSTRWIGQNTLFQLDFATKTAKPLSILGGEAGAHYRYWRQDGRTFLISYGKATYIQELKADGTLKPLALISSAHQFSYSENWRPPQAFVDAFNRDYPAQKYAAGFPGRPNHGFGMLWVDKDGDGKLAAEEIEFATAAQGLGGSGWGHDFHTLTLPIAATVDGKGVLVTLKPQGYWPGGAPKYPPLNEAIAAAVPIDLPAGASNAESTVDRFGNLILNTSPTMRAFGPDGKLLWTYPNRWAGVHGSHGAPLPSPGELQGVLFYTGVAPLDDKSDVVIMNGNHGRAFLMTTDGLYLDEMFPDVRLMTNPQGGGIGILGGECFGGTFGKASDGNYYFQGGGIDYRIYRVDGLKDTRRAEGAFTVSAAQALAAERNVARSIAAEAAPRRSTLAYRAEAPVVDGKSTDWEGEPTAAWDKQGQFPVTVRAAHDGTNLYLNYQVRGDASPWVNNGKDWQQLFKTGDGIDLQLGTSSLANPKRSEPAPGDMRLFIAPFEAGNAVVLYRHRQPGATDPVVFQSPWRSEKVDSVKRLEAARVVVAKGNNEYTVEVSVPLADLGLKAPFGKTHQADFGVIYGDAEGTTNIFRNYWANQSTGLVNDVPGEIMLTPNLWGQLLLGEVKP